MCLAALPVMCHTCESSVFGLSWRGVWCVAVYLYAASWSELSLASAGCVRCECVTWSVSVCWCRGRVVRCGRARRTVPVVVAHAAGRWSSGAGGARGCFVAEYFGSSSVLCAVSMRCVPPPVAPHIDYSHGAAARRARPLTRISRRVAFYTVWFDMVWCGVCVNCHHFMTTSKLVPHAHQCSTTAPVPHRHMPRTRDARDAPGDARRRAIGGCVHVHRARGPQAEASSHAHSVPLVTLPVAPLLHRHRRRCPAGSAAASPCSLPHTRALHPP